MKIDGTQVESQESDPKHCPELKVKLQQSNEVRSFSMELVLSSRTIGYLLISVIICTDTETVLR